MKKVIVKWISIEIIDDQKLNYDMYVTDILDLISNDHWFEFEYEINLKLDLYLKLTVKTSRIPTRSNQSED
jgi:hypothetical protein